MGDVVTALIGVEEEFHLVDLHTRRERYEQLDTTLDYSADAIGRSVMNPSQIRTVIRQCSTESCARSSARAGPAPDWSARG